MLTIERARRVFLRFPALMRLGLTVLVLGGFVDVLAHLESLDHQSHLQDHTTGEVAAHLVVFVGMVLIVIGVVRYGVRQTRAGRDPAGAPARESRDAVRRLR